MQQNKEGPHKRISVIVKPTHDCNLVCAYCYINPNAESGRMDEATLRSMTDKFLGIFDSISFIWHGGEPLTMPLAFYRRAVEIQGEHEGKVVTNGFQTNGTLVTDEVLDFCDQYKFHLGFSLDGPVRVNDRTRYGANHESVFDRIFAAMKKAKERKVGGGAIVVVSRANIADLVEIYEFAKSEGINLKLNPLIKSGRARGCYQDLAIGPEEYGRALVGLFDLWYTDGSDLRVDPFDELMGNILTEQPWGCNYGVSCQDSFISVGPRGDVYPCGRFDGVPGFRFGDINTDDLAVILDSERRQELRERILKVKGCAPCEYKRICNSGCMHNAFVRKGNIYDRDYYCASYKILFRHISEVIEKDVKEAEVEVV